MSVRRAGLVLLCAMLAVTCARRSSPEQEDVQEKTNSARCTSRCLTLHMTQLTAAFRHLQVRTSILPQILCFSCLQPCKELWETRKVASPKSCEKQTECVTSREFLASLRSSRQGDCPPPQRATGFAAACVESCSSDQHCPSPRKCCSNSCGHTCQAPANLYKGKGNFWSLCETLSEDAILSDLRPQRWYQFRVAAINSHGSRGFTTPSKHYISSKDPSPPEPPTNVRVSNQTLNRTQSASQFTERSMESGVTVAVLLRWEPPKEGDLPVHNYRITWMSRHTHAAQKHKHTLQAHTHTVASNTHARPAQSRTPAQGRKESNSRVTQGAQCEVWLHGLPPATSYLLSVQTVAYWGQKRLKSPRAQLVFTTIPHAGNEIKMPSIFLQCKKSKIAQRGGVIPVALGNLRLEVAAPHYHNNQLQVKVFWKWPQHVRQRHAGPYILRWRPHTCSTNVTSMERTTMVQVYAQGWGLICAFTSHFITITQISTFLWCSTVQSVC
uniref:Anosmin-1-like n=1 Tax=Haplochromis burtoni TaxID=8153 RepID=A0A3Q2WVL1_HAPBU